MGSYSPPSEVDDALVDRVMDEAVNPIVATLRRRGIDYRGVLYAGIMVTADGPVVLEYNVRFGDPEAQVVLPRLSDDPVDLLMAVAEGRLEGTPRFSSDVAVCVVAAAAGYPEAPVTGDAISGLGPDGQLADPVEGVTVLHAGTARTGDGVFRVDGGRVLGLTALAPTLVAARRRAYEAATRVTWAGRLMRADIALPPVPAGSLT
jgi:phosphoribosylamine--glycine ligase